jgi:hypothetical protein
MKNKKYNIALVPIHPADNQAFCELAELALKKSDHHVQCDYQLSLSKEKRSLPHVSVFQFSLPEGQDSSLKAIWQAVCQAWQANPVKMSTDSLLFKHKTDQVGEFAGVTWYELVVDKRANPELQVFHEVVLKALQSQGVSCLNAQGDRYSPHFTLFNTRGVLRSELSSEQSSFAKLPDCIAVMPVIGVANDQWELTEIIFPNLHIVESTQYENIIAFFQQQGILAAHFTNGTYLYSADRIVPTSLAGFDYLNSLEPLPMVVAINSDRSLANLGIQSDEDQRLRAEKVALPLCQRFPDRPVVVIFFDESTPNALYQRLSKLGLTKTLHKWGYGINEQTPKIEGAEWFQAVYAFPLPSTVPKPVCYALTAYDRGSARIQVVDILALSELRSLSPSP